MTKIASFTFVVAMTLPALAISQVASSLDVNGDGVLTIDEVQASYPEMSADSFSVMDLNADGALNADEVAAAQEAGLMPATDG